MGSLTGLVGYSRVLPREQVITGSICSNRSYKYLKVSWWLHIVGAGIFYSTQSICQQTVRTFYLLLCCFTIWG